VVVSGGGSNGDLFMRIIADATGLPAARTEVNGAVGLGSAICAAVGLGLCPSFEAAMTKMVRIRDVFEPNPVNVAFYARLYDEVYSKITKYTDEPLKMAYRVLNPA
jgi:sugar (pentulose or hexulose) kinase